MQNGDNGADGDVESSNEDSPLQSKSVSQGVVCALWTNNVASTGTLLAAALSDKLGITALLGVAECVVSCDIYRRMSNYSQEDKSRLKCAFYTGATMAAAAVATSAIRYMAEP